MRKRQTSTRKHYAADMSLTREIALGLAHNLNRLMEHFEMSQQDVSRKTGVAQRTISTLTNLENPSAINPRAETLERLAKCFGVPAWQLLVPELPLDLLLSRKLTKLVENYRDAPEEGRASVDRIAESEVRYAVTLEQTKRTGTGDS